MRLLLCVFVSLFVLCATAMAGDCCNGNSCRVPKVPAVKPCGPVVQDNAAYEAKTVTRTKTRVIERHETRIIEQQESGECHRKPARRAVAAVVVGTAHIVPHPLARLRARRGGC